MRAVSAEVPSGGEPGTLRPEERAFGDYELLEEIAHGGQGIVYKARQKSLGRLVAIKMLLLGPLANADYVQRFRFEAVAAGGLRHPNIVRIHEVGLHDGQPFIVMEFIEGQSLARHLANGPLPARRAAEYLHVIADAVHCAHESGILHRDLKPSNVLIDFLDQPHVTDFGLARRLDGDGGVTMSGQMLGSPNYIPPEQAVSKRGTVGRPSDVYGLGAVLYHLLTGRPPFAGESIAETIDQTLNSELVAPRLLNRSIPADLEVICLKCLEKEPPKRYPTAAELRDDLKRFLAGEPIRARPLGSLGRAWRWCRRKPALASALGGLALALAAGFLGIGWQAQRASREARRATAFAADAELNLYSADMLLAQQAFVSGNFGRGAGLVHRYGPGGESAPNGHRDLRGWEWRHLHHLTRQNENRILGRQDRNVSAIAVLNDGNRVASCGKDGKLCVWEVRSGTKLNEFAHPKPIMALAVASHRPVLASGCEDGLIRLWDTTDWRRLGEFNLGEPVQGVALAPDGDRVAAIGYTSTVLWDRKTGLEIVRLPVFLRPTAYWMEGVAFSPDGNVLAYSKAVGEIGLWEGRTRQDLPSIDVPEPGNTALSLAFSPDARFLAAGGHDGLTVWDWPARTIRIRFILTDQWTAGISFSPDSERLASVSDDQHVRLWNLRTGTLDRTLSGHEFEVWSSGFLPDGQSLVTGAKDRTIRIWPLGRETRSQDQRVLDDGVVRTALAPDASVALVQHATGNFELVQCGSMAGRPLVLPPVEDVTALAVAPAGTVIAIGTAGGVIRRFQTNPALELPVIRTADGEVKRMVFSANGQRLAAASGNRRVGVWTGANSEPTLVTPETESSVWSICLSDDATQLMVGSVLGRLTVWDLAARKSRAVDTGLIDEALAVTFSSDLRRIAASGWDSKVALLNFDGREVPAHLSGTRSGYAGVAFSHDGTRLAAARHEGGVQLWNIATTPPQEVLLLPSARPAWASLQLRFTSDDSALVLIDASQLRVWRAPR